MLVLVLALALVLVLVLVWRASLGYGWEHGDVVASYLVGPSPWELAASPYGLKSGAVIHSVMHSGSGSVVTATALLTF